MLIIIGMIILLAIYFYCSKFNNHNMYHHNKWDEFTYLDLPEDWNDRYRKHNTDNETQNN